jgi:hypothetical protein
MHDSDAQLALVPIDQTRAGPDDMSPYLDAVHALCMLVRMYKLAQSQAPRTIRVPALTHWRLWLPGR